MARSTKVIVIPKKKKRVSIVKGALVGGASAAAVDAVLQTLTSDAQLRAMIPGISPLTARAARLAIASLEGAGIGAGVQAIRKYVL